MIKSSSLPTCYSNSFLYTFISHIISSYCYTRVTQYLFFPLCDNIYVMYEYKERMIKSSSLSTCYLTPFLSTYTHVISSYWYIRVAVYCLMTKHTIYWHIIKHRVYCLNKLSYIFWNLILSRYVALNKCRV